MSNAAGKKKATAPPAPVYVSTGNGYYTRQGGDPEQLYYLGTNNQYYPVLRIRVSAGAVMPQADRNALIQYLMANNNAITNAAGQTVRITSVVVTESLHKSKSTDTNTTDHYSVQLSNATLQANDNSSHLLHFRPTATTQFYYPNAMTRTDITKLQEKRNVNRHRKKPAGGGSNNNKKPPPSGGGASTTTKVSGKK